MRKLFLFTLTLLLSGYSFGQEPVNPAFTQRLPIPPVLENRTLQSGNSRLKLTVRKGSVNFFKGMETSTFGFNGDYLGPTIRVKNGEAVNLTVDNTLDEMTTVHWHGLHVPAEMDGGPHQGIEPGTRWNPSFTIKQPAATLWYHPHPIGKTGEQVYRGLAGLFIIDDEVSAALNIPKSYGADDIPLVLQDRRFNSKGDFAYVGGMPDIMQGVIGDWMLVNGSIQPYLDVANIKIRFRVLNGSNSSVYRLSLGDKSSFFQIASDGGFLEKPVEMSTLILSAGERAEIIVDFSRYGKGSTLHLEAEDYRGSRFRAMQFRISKEARDTTELPEILTRIERIPATKASKTRRFDMRTMGMGGQLTINGRSMNMNRIDERVNLGATEIWEIRNVAMGMMQIPHSFHIHDIQFQILTVDGKEPPANERGWKDTVVVWPGEVVRIITTFEDYTGIYMYHCHFLEHEDAGMMGQFEVARL